MDKYDSWSWGSCTRTPTGDNEAAAVDEAHAVAFVTANERKPTFRTVVYTGSRRLGGMVETSTVSLLLLEFATMRMGSIVHVRRVVRNSSDGAHPSTWIRTTEILLGTTDCDDGRPAASTGVKSTAAHTPPWGACPATAWQRLDGRRKRTGASTAKAILMAHS